MPILQLVRYGIFAILDFVFTIFASVCVNWWAPFFAVTYTDDTDPRWTGKSLQRLPKWLAWFDTFDASTDAGWRDGYFTNVYGVDDPPKYWLRKWYQVRWLWRNPGYGFSYFILGTKMDTSEWTYTYTKFADGSDKWWAYTKDGRFNLSYGGKWGSYKLGWKAWNYFDADAQTWKPGYQWGPKMRTPCVFSINPFRGLKALFRKKEN